MGKDKRKIIECVTSSMGHQAYICYQSPPVLVHRRIIFDVTIPSSAEEIIMQLDIRGVKWKAIRFDDRRHYQGVLDQRKTYAGDVVYITKDDMVKPEIYQSKIEKINRSILAKRVNSITASNSNPHSRWVKFPCHVPTH